MLQTARPPVPAHAPPRVARASAEGPAGEETLAAHAGRVLRSRLRAVATGLLDPCIALLQSLRRAAGAAPVTDAGDGDLRSRKDRPGERAEATPMVESAAPRPRRRLRALLVYLGVLLAGGMGGGALAYELLETMVIDLFVENQRLEAAHSAQSRAAAAARQELEQAQARRGEAEKKLAALRTEIASAAPARPDKLAPAALARPATMPAGERTGRKEPQSKANDCSMIPSDNISALMDCIHKFNR